MTPAEFESAYGRFLFEEWLARIGWDREALRGFFEHGIPVEYARAIADTSKGRFPITIWPKLLHAPKVLTGRRAAVNTTSTEMENSHRVAISRSKRRKDDRITAAINKAGYSQGDIAEKLGISTAALSRYISGDRRIPESRAVELEKLAKISRSWWPKGVASDEA